MCLKAMPVRLSTTIRKITSLPNATSEAVVSEFHQYMMNNGAGIPRTDAPAGPIVVVEVPVSTTKVMVLG
jgi:hypothetical protein